MERRQFRILFRHFLFRLISPDLLSRHAQGDSLSLVGQILSLLLFCSVLLALRAWAWSATAKSDLTPQIVQLTEAWSNEHFLIATTMLAVGLFAVLSWDSFLPDDSDALVLGPLPIRVRTLFLAKVSAVATALGLVIVALNSLAGITWPMALAQSNPKPSPALIFDPALRPVSAEDFPTVMNRDIAPLVRDLNKTVPGGRSAIAIGVSTRGVRRIVTYGAAKQDSIFEIGSVTKTFTGLLLAQMAIAGDLDLHDPVRNLLQPGAVAAPRNGFEMTLLDLATHHSGLPSIPVEAVRSDPREFYTTYRNIDLLQFIQDRGVGKRPNTGFEYSNLGFALLGAALSNRAGLNFSTLVHKRIAGPLRMADTAVQLSSSQGDRLLTGHDAHGRATPAWDLDAFASAGGLRSTAGDLLKYLDAQLHPDKTPFGEAIRQSHILRNYVAGDIRVALAWMFNPETGTYEHSGATGGFFSYVCFDPHRDFAAVVLLNAFPTVVAAVPLLGDHVRQRLAGEPAVSLDTVLVKPSGFFRNLAAYWMVTLAAGLFTLSLVLAFQACGCWLLPRRLFLRASALLQIAIFCALVFAYFTLASPASVLLSGSNQPWRAAIPSYWFVGLYQQLSGSLHPALRPFALRAWIALAASIVLAAVLQAASYRLAIAGILEQPQIAPAVRGRWLPRFGSLFETAIVRFAIRGVMRSPRHRMILSFYLGIGFAFMLLYLEAPREIAGPTAEKPWEPLSVPLLASTIALLGTSLVGVRKVFSLPLDLPARWIFCAAPVRAGLLCLRATRRAYYAVAVAPVWVVSAAILLVIWPLRPAIAHLAALGLVAVIVIEHFVGGVQRIPFCCSLLPGKSKLYLTFWFWCFALFVCVIKLVEAERAVLQSSFATAALLIILAALALISVIWNNRRAQSADAELRFEEAPANEVLTLRLSE